MLIHVVPAIANEASGPSYSVTRLCAELDAQGHDVDLVTLDWAPMEEPPPFVRRFPIGRGPRSLGRSPEMVRWLMEQGKSGEASMIHNHSLWMMPNVYPGRVARLFDIPLMVSPRGTLSEFAFSSGSPMKRLFWPLVQRPALQDTTCFHATAVSEYEDIRGVGFRQPVAIIPNGIDIPVARVKSSGAGATRTLLFLGRIHKIKGLDILLSAWYAVQDRFPDWELRIAGPDNDGYLEEMQKLARHLHLNRIEFTGPVYGEAKWQLYGEADLFVLPSYSENFGMSVAEALAAGTPAIVSQGAPWEGLEAHDAGHWIEMGVDPLVTSLERLMARPAEDLIEMGLHGREWVARDFSWQRVGEQMAQTYRWILEGGRRPSFVKEH